MQQLTFENTVLVSHLEADGDAMMNVKIDDMLWGAFSGHGVRAVGFEPRGEVERRGRWLHLALRHRLVMPPTHALLLYLHHPARASTFFAEK